MSGITSMQHEPSATSHASSSSSEPRDQDAVPSASLAHGKMTQPANNPSSTTFSSEGKDQALLQGILDEVRKLANTLEKPSGRTSGQALGTPERNLYDPQDVYENVPEHLEAWAEHVNNTDLEIARKLFLRLLQLPDFKLHSPSSESNLKTHDVYEKSTSHLRLAPRALPQSQTLRAVASPGGDVRPLADQARHWVEEKWTTALAEFGEAAQFHLAVENQNASADQAASENPCGKIWWITDTCYAKPSRTPRGVLSVSLVALLAHTFCLFRDSQNYWSSDEAEMERFRLETEEKHVSLVLPYFKDFLLAFCNLSYPSAKQSLHDYAGEDRLQFHYHLRHFAPVTPEEPASMPAQNLFLLLERQTAKIHYSDEKNGQKIVLNLKERVLSISLTMLSRCGTFSLVVIGDKGVAVTASGYTDGYRDICTFYADDLKSLPWDKIGIDPWASGKRSGAAHFLVSLSLLLEAWHTSWNATLDDIDSVVRFKMSHTLSDDRIKDFMFDKTDSMDLSKQYFTVLQILRIASEWIDASVADWDRMKQGIIEVFELRQFFRESGSDQGEPLQDQLDKITQLVARQAKQLQERINRKSEEVKSLRDGV